MKRRRPYPLQVWSTKLEHTINKDIHVSRVACICVVPRCHQGAWGVDCNTLFKFNTLVLESLISVQHSIAALFQLRSFSIALAPGLTLDRKHQNRFQIHIGTTRSSNRYAGLKFLDSKLRSLPSSDGLTFSTHRAIDFATYQPYALRLPSHIRYIIR